ncbi:MAG TPA: ABC transporter ATP-binding protein [Longimicrobiales bacterium]|nr:ABC transporter ATP-binding protein [Longimicrobiales bacterium]
MTDLFARVPNGKPGAWDVRPSAPAVRTESLRRVYESGDTELVVLDGVDVEVGAGEAVAIIGTSGAGKSTLLHLLGGLDQPSGGEVIIAGRELSGMGSSELATFRNRVIGFVFQFHHLLREFSAVENVMMPMLIAGEELGPAEARAMELLGEVGLTLRASHRPSQLSGGEQQRVAVARALANRPAVLIADEPSGNLDTHTSEQLHDLFFRLRAEHGVALVLATHNRELADRTDRVLRLADGRLENLYPDAT